MLQLTSSDISVPSERSTVLLTEILEGRRGRLTTGKDAIGKKKELENHCGDNSEMKPTSARKQRVLKINKVKKNGKC